MRALVVLALLVGAVVAQEYGGATPDSTGKVQCAARTRAPACVRSIPRSQPEPKCCPGIPTDPCSPALPLCAAGHPNSPLGRIPNAPTCCSAQPCAVGVPVCAALAPVSVVTTSTCGCVALAVCPCRPATVSSMPVSQAPVLGANYGPSVVGSAFGSRPLHFAKIDGCDCLGLASCPCRPAGNLVSPVPEFVKPEEKQMVAPHAKEMVAPFEKAQFDPFNSPVGRRAPLRRIGCGCRRLVLANVMSPTDCACMMGPRRVVTSTCCTVEPCGNMNPCANRLRAAVVNGGLVRDDIVTNVFTTA